MSTTNGDNAQHNPVDERTPLLPSIRRTNSRETVPANTTYLYNIERDIYAHHPLSSDPHDIVNTITAADLRSPESGTALQLLLCLRRINGTFVEALPGTPPLHIPHATKVEAYAISLWETLLTQEDGSLVEEILWMDFYLEEGNESKLSVIDVVFDGAPQALSLHSAIRTSMLDIWASGIRRRIPESDELSLIARVQKLASPRVLHILDLAFLFLYLGFYANYIFRPARPISILFDPIDWRPIVLLALGLPRLFNDTANPTPFFITILAFLSGIPSWPGPNDTSYVALLFAFAVHIVQLQLPIFPSPIFLGPAGINLPLGVILNSLYTDIFVPGLGFFLPAFILIMYLLSISLSELYLLTADFFTTSLSMLEPAPVNARVAFLLLLLFSLGTFLCLIFAMVLMSPGIRSARGATRVWDIYGSRIGLKTRGAFLQAIRQYSNYYFPAPLNAFELLFITIPIFVTSAIGKKELTIRITNEFRPWLWRATVLPFAILFSSLWGWGLFRNRRA